MPLLRVLLSYVLSVVVRITLVTRNFFTLGAKKTASHAAVLQHNAEPVDNERSDQAYGERLYPFYHPVCQMKAARWVVREMPKGRGRRPMISRP